MNAYITVKLPDGTYKNVEFDSIEQIFVSVKGEKTVLFNCDNNLEFGVVEEVKPE